MLGLAAGTGAAGPTSAMPACATKRAFADEMRQTQRGRGPVPAVLQRRCRRLAHVASATTRNTISDSGVPTRRASEREISSCTPEVGQGHRDDELWGNGVFISQRLGEAMR